MGGASLSAMASLLAAGLLLAASSPAGARVSFTDGGHGFGRMGPRNARTTSVDPATGPDFEMPFVCGQVWTGTTRASHSPSPYAVDFNTPNDLGKPALASAPGVVTQAVTLTGSYGRFVVVDHGGGYSTLYAHLNAIAATVGTYLDQGDLVGYVGGSGNVTGPHLHFEERKDGAYFPPYFHRTRYVFGTTSASGNCGDRPVVGDWTGDGRADVGVVHSAPSTGQFRELRDGVTRGFRWGTPDEIPLAGDWDGNGRSDVGSRAFGTSVVSLRSGSGGRTDVPVGLASDTPVSGDWDGDHHTDLGYYRGSTHSFGLRAADGSVTSVPWGQAGSRPVTGDWNHDGRTDVGVFDPATATWSLRVVRPHGVVTRTVAFGSPGDVPVTGDWNGDGVTDLGTWTPASATFTRRTPGASPGVYETSTVVYGSPR